MTGHRLLHAHRYCLSMLPIMDARKASIRRVWQVIEGKSEAGLASCLFIRQLAIASRALNEQVSHAI